MDPHLRFDNVEKQRDRFTLRIPDIEINQGDVLGVIGNNGAGKSTMIQLVLGLILQTKGTIFRYAGEKVENTLHEWKKDVGFVFDDLSVYDDLNMKLLSKFLGEVYPTWEESYFFSLLEQFHIDPKKKVKNFSRGMRMKAGIASALAHRPKLLILDEPTSGLDTKSRKQMIRLLKETNEKEGTTVIFSSHILADMEQLATSVWFMDEGEILLHGSIDELRANHAVDGNGRIQVNSQEGVKQATLDDLHDYYLGGDTE